MCTSCNHEGFCYEGLNAAKDANIRSDCLCQDVNDFCIAYSGGTILNLWEYYGDTGPTEDPAFLEALGFGVGHIAVRSPQRRA